MASDRCPMLARVIPEYEAYIKRLEISRDHPPLAKYSEVLQKAIDVAKKYRSWMGRTDVYAISMCECCREPLHPLQLTYPPVVIHPCYKDVYIRDKWGADKDEAITLIKDKVGHSPPMSYMGSYISHEIIR